MPTIVHFEIPSDDIERSKVFYKELFGWNLEKWSGSNQAVEEMEYLMITTTDEKGNKSLTGGMMKRQNPQHRISQLKPCSLISTKRMYYQIPSKRHLI
jgi:predicted enzyme related to lactoylglutathione lyase